MTSGDGSQQTECAKDVIVPGKVTDGDIIHASLGLFSPVGGADVFRNSFELVEFLYICGVFPESLNLELEFAIGAHARCSEDMCDCHSVGWLMSVTTFERL